MVEHFDGCLFERATRASRELARSFRELKEPLRCKTPQRIRFDERVELFDSAVTDEWRDKIFAVMALAPQHTFIVSTVFPERMRAYLSHPNTSVNIGLEALQMVGDDLASNPESTLGKGITLDATDINPGALTQWPLPNVWLGVAVRRQTDADVGIPRLLHTPAAVRFVTCDPLLGPVNLDLGWNNDLARWDGQGRELPLRRIDWVIVGGESGRDARPMHPDWVRSLRDQCAAANVPFWFMQWGEFIPAHVEDDPAYAGGRAFDDPTGGRASPCIRIPKKLPRTKETIRLMEPGERTKRAVMLDRDTIAIRAGAAKAGRLLDGVEHNGYPERG